MARYSLLAGTALALVVGFAGSAFAADLPTRKAPLLPPPPPAFSWNGLYGGVNLGYGFNANSSITGGQAFAQTGPFFPYAGGAPVNLWGAGLEGAGSFWNQSTNLNGVTGGGQLGYNYQFNPWLVIGVETDIQAADIRSAQRIASTGGVGVAGITTAAQYVDWWGTVRGRVGFTLPSWSNLMVYGTGGFAYGSVQSDHRFTRFDSFGLSQSAGAMSSTNTGWTAGGGVEWTPLAFPSWSFKAEYLYTDLGSVRDAGFGYNAVSNSPLTAANTPLALGNVIVSPGLALASVNSASYRFNTVRVGANWHFNPLEALQPSAVASPLVTKGPAAPVEDSYQPFQVRLKVAGVVPTNGTAAITDRGTGNYLQAPFLGVPNPSTALAATGWSGGLGTPFIGSNTTISSSVIPEIDVSYFLNKNWAIEAICCVSPHHVTGQGPLYAQSVIKSWVFPPSLLLQYHFTNFGALQPYLGVGVNYTAFWGTRPGNQNFVAPVLNPALNATMNALTVQPATIIGTATAASITSSWGVVGQGGLDYMLNEHWGVNLDVKYIMMEPNAHVWGVASTAPLNAGPVAVPLNLAVKINPLVISGGLTYRFGGSLGLPRLF
jgi:outer membrane immunogenic protein